ncbi:MAG: lipid-binding SYLF domain-containing protein [Alphaproteobacteria bacterium]
MRLLAVSAAIAFSLAAAPFAQAAPDQQQAVDEALNVVRAVHDGSGDIAAKTRELIHHSRAVLIVPELVKGGFIFGAQGGTGVLLARDDRDNWSDPAFYDLGAASFGFQIGIEVSKVVLIIMSDRALNAVMENKVKLGAEAGLAIATLGAGAEASTTTNAGADIYVVAESKGLFGGVAIEGGVMSPHHEWDAAYYGRDVSARDIVVHRTVSNPGAAALRRALGEI